ncbi:hypothetical protein [Asticcacaulis sp. AC402]|uniref:hypothetical protein n=1 Tax=Asticcacaulis sp. AC402 TaxID=1282361 RepID=UPI0003C3C1D8|nr:hypothetical protein [Asticcacaulis sp. AC402]ESQ75211.1 hypothetical protein ABAC402_11115 [Asticcacaulis sp. AC402]
MSRALPYHPEIHSRGRPGGVTVALFCVLLSAVSFAAWAVPRPGNDMAVIVSPWASRPDALLAIIRAGGQPTAAGRWSFIAFAGDGDDDFVSHLYASGAWLVIDAGGLTGCRSPISGV